MLKFNLQFFTEEKTEEATPKKKRDARKKGQVAQSKDVGAALILITVLFTIQLTSGWFTDQFFQIYHLSSNMISRIDVLYNPLELQRLFAEIVMRAALILAPILGVALISGVLASYLQVGYLFSLEAIQPKLDKINPINGFKRLFSMKSLVEMVKAIAKGSVLIYLVYDYLNDRLVVIAGSFQLDLGQFIALMWDFIVNIVLRCAGFLLIVAFADLAYKRWQHNKDLRMSKRDKR